MINKEFDKKLKNTVDKHPSAIDVDSFWNAIEEDVKDINAKKKKKRIVPFYFLGIALFTFASILSGIYSISSDFSVNNDYENQTLEQNENKNIVSLDEKTNEDEIINLSDELPNRSMNRVEHSEQGEQFSTFVGFGHAQPTPHFNSSKSEINNNQDIDFPKKKKIENPEIIESKKMSLRESPALFPKLENLKLKSFTKYRYQRKKTWQFNLGIQGGANFAPRKLESIDADSAPYATLRNETETSKIGFQFGLKFGITHKSGLTFSSGLNYTQITERFKYQGSTFQEVFVENGIIRYEW